MDPACTRTLSEELVKRLAANANEDKSTLLQQCQFLKPDRGSYFVPGRELIAGQSLYAEAYPTAQREITRTGLPSSYVWSLARCEWVARQPNDRIFIYSLYSENDKTPKYVGATVHPESRLQGHCVEARKNKSNKDIWIQKLWASDDVLLMCILEECDAVSWREAEARWCRTYKDTILNKDPGGLGNAGREKIRFTELFSKYKPFAEREKIGLRRWVLNACEAYSKRPR